MSKFKKGDRVRLTSDENRDLGLKVGDLGTVVEDSSVPYVDWDRLDERWAVIESEIEPVAVAPATATLQIEAGKFYKTRDGRKVGPLVVQDDDVFPFLDEGACESYRPDGGWKYPRDGQCDNDIVAEWVGEPSVPTTADTRLIILPEVGDTVLVTGRVTGTTTSAKGTHYNVTVEPVGGKKVSLHFNAVDLIIIPPTDGADCDNDNAPTPLKPDTSAAFDALANSIFGLTVRVREAA